MNYPELYTVILASSLFLSPAGTNAPRNAAPTVKKAAANFSTQLSPALLRSFSQLVLDTGQDKPEGGGMVYLLKGSLHFQPLRNQVEDDLVALLRMDLMKPAGLGALEEYLGREFGTGTCSMENSDAGWRQRIAELRSIIDELDTGAVKSEVYLTKMTALRDSIMEISKDHYKREEPKLPAGAIPYILVHTHRNRSSASGTDICLSEQTAVLPMFILAYDYPTSKKKEYDIHVVVGGKQKKLGTFPITPK